MALLKLSLVSTSLSSGKEFPVAVWLSLLMKSAPQKSKLLNDGNKLSGMIIP